MSDAINRYLGGGTYTVTFHVEPSGQQQGVQDQLRRGRLSHYSVANRKQLEKAVISAIIDTSKMLRDQSNKKMITIHLRQRKKRIKQESIDG